VTDYPWFTQARMLVLKGYKDLDPDKYSEALKISALYAANRKMLHDFLAREPLPDEIFRLEESKEIEQSEEERNHEPLPDDGLLLSFGNEYFSFDDYKTIDEEPEQEEELSQNELIDKFIRDNPRIIPRNAEYDNDDVFAGLEPEDMVSETLAEIYASQGVYDSAIKCYEKLILLDPEKSIYFANLIDSIKNRKTNKNR
jgi:tetratricopeptide (TPR) repeat protein